MTAITSEPFTDEWVADLVAASADREPVANLTGVVALGIGSKVDAANADVTVAIEAGRLLGASSEAAEAVVGLSKKQVAAWTEGDLVLTEAYMKGDLKPTGASGPLFAALELLDWATSAARRGVGDS